MNLDVGLVDDSGGWFNQWYSKVGLVSGSGRFSVHDSEG